MAIIVDSLEETDTDAQLKTIRENRFTITSRQDQTWAVQKEAISLTQA